ncbi:MAG: hypothetical protein V4481_04715 [Patescibacteria group bacterium]
MDESSFTDFPGTDRRAIEYLFDRGDLKCSSQRLSLYYLFRSRLKMSVDESLDRALRMYAYEAICKDDLDDARWTSAE